MIKLYSMKEKIPNEFNHKFVHLTCSILEFANYQIIYRSLNGRFYIAEYQMGGNFWLND